MKLELIERHFVPNLAVMSVAPADDIAATIVDLRDSFALLDDWTDKYQYIIDLGKSLPPLPNELRTDAHRLHGCQSMVWLGIKPQGGRLYIYAASDAAIVSGLIALVEKVYNGRSPNEILATAPDFLREVGLFDHLSPTRNNGLHALVEAVQTIAQHAQRLEGAAA